MLPETIERINHMKKIKPRPLKQRYPEWVYWLELWRQRVKASKKFENYQAFYEFKCNSKN